MNEMEGSWESKGIGLIRKFGYNKDVDVLLGTVIAPPPNIRIKIDKSLLELDKDDVIVAQHITNYTVPFSAIVSKANYESAPFGTLNEKYVDESGQYAEQKKLYHSLGFIFDTGMLTMNNELKAGERVIVAEIEKGQRYVVLDRAVKY